VLQSVPVYVNISGQIVQAGQDSQAHLETVQEQIELSY